MESDPNLPQVNGVKTESDPNCPVAQLTRIGRRPLVAHAMQHVLRNQEHYGKRQRLIPKTSTARRGSEFAGSRRLAAIATDDVEIPVPIAMSAAEIDERAQAVEAQTGNPARLSDEELQP